MKISLEKLDRLKDSLKSATDNDLRKTEDGVFDYRTLKVIQKLFSQGKIRTLENIIATGKEANVFRGKTLDNRNRAVKIYRLNTSTFRKLAPYIEGDPRFQDIGHGHWDRVYTWAQKEYKNLHSMWAAGVKVPKPITVDNNVLIMEYFGWRYRPYPMIKDKRPENPREYFKKLMDSMKKYRKVGLSHGDLSEYNILNYRENPVIIDVGQAVSKGHPMFDEMHERDRKNIYRFFRKMIPELKIEAIDL